MFREGKMRTCSGTKGGHGSGGGAGDRRNFRGTERVVVAGHGQQVDVGGEGHGGENDDCQWSALATGLLVIFFMETENQEEGQMHVRPGDGDELSSVGGMLSHLAMGHWS